MLALAQPPRFSTTSASSLPCGAACLTSSAAADVASDVRALHIRAALALAGQPDDHGLSERLPLWTEELPAAATATC